MRDRPTISHALALLLLLASPVVATFEPLALLERPEPPPPSQFGRAVAVDGNTVVVGMFGGVYVFERRGPREFVPVARLRPSIDLGPVLVFGTSVAVSGDTIAVGTMKFSSPVTVLEQVFVYERPATGWRDMMETTRIVSPLGRVSFFGESVALDGDTLVIGDPAGGTNFGGEVYVYERSAGAWGSPVAVLPAPRPGEFGWDVALSGSALAVGAPSVEIDGFAGHGAAYVFSRSGASWTSVQDPPAELLPSDGSERLFFGHSVDVEGTTALVGAPLSTEAAYLYERPPGGWISGTETARLQDPLNTEGFGVDVAVEGDWAFVGSFQPIPLGTVVGNRSNAASASAFVWSLLEQGTVGDPVNGVIFGYERPSGGWVDLLPSLELRLGEPGVRSDGFGFSLAADERLLVGGAPFWDLDALPSSGLVAVFAQPLVTEIPVGRVALGVLVLTLAVMGLGVLRFVR